MHTRDGDMVSRSVCSKSAARVAARFDSLTDVRSTERCAQLVRRERSTCCGNKGASEIRKTDAAHTRGRAKRTVSCSDGNIR